MILVGQPGVACFPHLGEAAATEPSDEGVAMITSPEALALAKAAEGGGINAPDLQLSFVFSLMPGMPPAALEGLILQLVPVVGLEPTRPKDTRF